MIPPNDLILSVRQMQAAEQALIDAGTSVDELMQRAGRGAAEWVWRIAAGRSVTILCGPGNNGGDGYVIAEALRKRGLQVTVIAPMAPTTDAAKTAQSQFKGEVLDSPHKASGGLFVDCLFGTGLSRGLSDDLADMLAGLASRHQFCVAVDLPSGVNSDSGALFSSTPDYDLTIALGAWKWAHWIMPAAAQMGHRHLVPIGVDSQAQRDFTTGKLLSKPSLGIPPVNAHKYSRGMVAIVVGAMPGAAILAARAAMHGGAGYVKLLSNGQSLDVPADLVVDSRPLAESLAEERISALLIGPGLGTDAQAQEMLQAVLELRGSVPTVLDADALNLIDEVEWPEPNGRQFIFTPHAGELKRLSAAFGIEDDEASLVQKVQEAIEIGSQTAATVVAKGPDTVIFSPELGISVSPAAPSWLSVAGTGDVLAGIIASRLATGVSPFEAAAQGVWLHGEAARLASGPFTASELAGRVAEAYAACL